MFECYIIGSINYCFFSFVVYFWISIPDMMNSVKFPKGGNYVFFIILEKLITFYKILVRIYKFNQFES